MAKRAVLPDAGVFRQEFTLPTATPAGVATAEPEGPPRLSFWEQVHAIPDAEWWSGSHGDKGYKLYLYRSERKGYIEIIHEDCDEEYIKQRFGGGEFKGILNDPAGRTVASERFYIVGAPKDEAAAQTSAAPAPAADPFQAQILEIFRENNRQMQMAMDRMLTRLETLGTAPAAANPTAETMTMSVLPTIVKGVVDMFASSVPKPSDPLELLVKLQTLLPRQPDILELLVKAKAAGLIPDAGGNGSLLSQISELAKVAETLGWNPGGGGGSKSMAEVLIDKAPSMLQELSKVVDSYRGVEQARAQTIVAANSRGVQQLPPPAAPAQPTILPPSPSGVAAARPAAAQSGMTLDVEPVGTAPAQQQQQQPAAAGTFNMSPDEVKTKIVHAIAQGSTGVDIVNFLEAVAPELLDLMDGIDAAGIAQWCALDPILKNAVALPRFQQCVKEIVEDLSAAAAGPEALPN